jgi:hypothetical protein
MGHNMKKILLVLLATLFIGLPGCSSYKKKFKSKRIANIGLFADSTIAMLSDLNLTLSREDTILARHFFDTSAPEEQLVMEKNMDLKEVLGNVVRYSIEIVNIVEGEGTETNKVEKYALYVTKFRDSMIKHELIDEEMFDKTIEEIAQQTEMINALRLAQPLIDAAIMSAALGVDDLIYAVEDLSKKMDRRIDEEYSDIIRYRKKLEREKFDILTAFEIIYDAYRNDEPTLHELKESGVIWTPEIIPEGRPTRVDLQNIGEHLHSRIVALDTVQEKMRPNWEDYLSTHKEVDRISDNTILSIRQSRIVLLTWARAHQKMVSGTTDSAEWFDIGEVTKSLVKTAPKAVL